MGEKEEGIWRLLVVWHYSSLALGEIRDEGIYESLLDTSWNAKYNFILCCLTCYNIRSCVLGCL